MLISSTEKDQITFPSEIGFDPLKCLENVNELSPSSVLSDPSSLPINFADINLPSEQDQRRNELQRLISGLEEEIAQFRLKQRYCDQRRRAALNKLLDLKGSVRVFCRIRPFLRSDRKAIDQPISAGSEKILVRSASVKKEFDFDKVFSPNSTQEDVFAEVEPILRSAMDGHNVCILAYGQTGTGKTFTMEGTSEEQGIVPRALKELFQQATIDKSAQITFSMSMLEVYMGNLKDLLARKPLHRAYEPVAKCNLNIQTDPRGVVEIEGLSSVTISDLNKAIWWYNRGRRVRSTSCTNVNDVSSRSHWITIVQHGEEAKVSKLWMVDLGGSERLLKTGARGQTLDEGRAINLSLSALGDVVASLRRKRNHIPYRNSKLTQILKDSLGHGSKVLMLVHVSPCEEDVAETICSLSFAKRASAVECNQESSEDIKHLRKRRMVELTDELRNSEEYNQKILNQIKKAEFLLDENRKLLATSAALQPSYNEEVSCCSPSPTGANEGSLEKTPQICAVAARKNSLPRFMTSTVASRQRQCSSEKLLHSREIRSLRSVTTTVRSSIQLTSSQSIGYTDPRLKAILVSSSAKKSGEPSPVNKENDHNVACNDNGNVVLKTSCMPGSKIVVAPPLNSNDGGAKGGRHRRRMSNLI